MADTNFGTNHPLAVKLWSRKLYEEVIGESFFSKFMGKGSDSLLQLKEETQKGPGDRIRVGLRMLMTGAGVQGDGALEGNEESLTTFFDDVLIDQLRHAHRTGGYLSSPILQ